MGVVVVQSNELAHSTSCPFPCLCSFGFGSLLAMAAAAKDFQLLLPKPLIEGQKGRKMKHSLQQRQAPLPLSPSRSSLNMTELP